MEHYAVCGWGATSESSDRDKLTRFLCERCVCEGSIPLVSTYYYGRGKIANVDRGNLGRYGSAHILSANLCFLSLSSTALMQEEVETHTRTGTHLMKDILTVQGILPKEMKCKGDFFWVDTETYVGILLTISAMFEQFWVKPISSVFWVRKFNKLCSSHSPYCSHHCSVPTRPFFPLKVLATKGGKNPLNDISVLNISSGSLVSFLMCPFPTHKTNRNESLEVPGSKFSPCASAVIFLRPAPPSPVALALCHSTPLNWRIYFTTLKKILLPAWSPRRRFIAYFSNYPSLPVFRVVWSVSYLF